MFCLFVIALTVCVLSVANAATYTTGTFLATSYTTSSCTETSVDIVKGYQLGQCQFQGTGNAAFKYSQCVTTATGVTITKVPYTDDACVIPAVRSDDLLDDDDMTTTYDYLSACTAASTYSTTDYMVYSCVENTDAWNDGWIGVNAYDKFYGGGDNTCTNNYYMWETSSWTVDDADSCSWLHMEECELNESYEGSDGGYHEAECVNGAWTTGANIALAVGLIFATVTFV